MATTQLRHFCTHALDDIIDFCNTSSTRGAYDLYTREAVQWIRSAQKFSYSWAEAETVPEDLTRQWLTDDHPRLPFEFTAIELVDNYRLAAHSTKGDLSGASYTLVQTPPRSPADRYQSRSGAS